MPTLPAALANSAAPPPATPAAKRTETPSPVRAFGPYRPPTTGAKTALSIEQQRNLDAFIQLYSRPHEAIEGADLAAS